MEQYYRTHRWRTRVDADFAVSEKKQQKKVREVLDEETGVGTELESGPVDETPDIGSLPKQALRARR